MTFGIIIALMTIAAIWLAFWPAWRRSSRNAAADHRAEFEHDLAVYKDQLKELQAEVDRQAMGASEAQQARTEIARRLLEAETKISQIDDATQNRADRKFGNIALVATAIAFVPIVTLYMYYSIGSPTLEAQPLQARIEAAQKQQLAANQEGEQLRILVERAEVHLKANPSDGRGWEVLAPIYFRLGEGDKSRDAYTRAINILGENAPRLSGLGEVQVAIAGGAVNAEARSSFEKAAAIDPNDGRSQFFLGLAMAQSGNVQQAQDIWRSLTQNPDSQSEWRLIAERQLTALSPTQELDAGMAPPIDQDMLDNTQGMSEEDRQLMIEGMVSQLDSRLTEQGGTVEEWLRLIRARLVLDQRERAENDLSRALEAFANEPEKEERLRALARDMNLLDEAVETQ